MSDDKLEFEADAQSSRKGKLVVSRDHRGGVRLHWDGAGIADQVLLPDTWKQIVEKFYPEGVTR